ncbi:MAG: Hsp20/alpha crystallin family protein [Patescibacteria group bacterium]
MSLIKWTPFFADTLGFDDMDKALSGMLPAVAGREFGFTPAVDVYEDKNNIIVETQLAGIDPNDVNISIEHDTLYIKGESEKKSEVDEKNYYRKEIRRGSFYRSILLPTQVSGDDAKAVTEGGVLKITIPKASKTEPKKIKIENKK